MDVSKGWMLEKVKRVLSLGDNAELAHFGIGTGCFTVNIASQLGIPLSNVCCIEARSKLAECAEERGLCIRTQKFEEFMETASKHAFDGALFNETFHLVSGGESLKQMKKLARILKPGGRILIVLRAASSGLPFWQKAQEVHSECTAVAAALDDYREVLQQAGFRNIELHEFDEDYNLTNHRWEDMVRARFWGCLNSFTDEELVTGLKEVSSFQEFTFKDTVFFLAGTTASSSVGTLHDIGLTALLPANLQSLRTSACNLEDFRLGPGTHLNHAAFGTVLGAISDLDQSLRVFAERNPAYFQDELCSTLIQESATVASEILGGRCILLPNCCTALKSTMEVLLEENDRVAYLPPLDGVTRKLLSHTCRNLHEIELKDSFWCEDPDVIVAALDRAHISQPFNVLVADHVAPQSGRWLPLASVIEWCQRHNVVSVIDGTHNADFNSGVWSDYYFFSSHMWLMNIKTCAIVRVAAGRRDPAPMPISFGSYEEEPCVSSEILDYMPYILLQKALRVHQSYGKHLCLDAGRKLVQGLRKIGKPMLVGREGRVMNLIEVHRVEDGLRDKLAASAIDVSVVRWEDKTYFRVSAWAYTTEEDFTALYNFLSYNLSVDSSPAVVGEHACMAKRREIFETFNLTCDKTNALHSQLSNRAFFTRSEPLRHPPIFYFGHTAVFYINKLVLSTYLSFDSRVDPELESLCAVGVDEMSWDDLNLGKWDQVPPQQQADEVYRLREYRRKVRELIGNFIMDESTPLELPINKDSPFWVILMGIEHENIHFETSSVIIARLPIDLVRPSALFPLYNQDHGPAPSNKLVPVEGGEVSFGKSWEDAEFYGWDNEFGVAQSVTLESFEVSQMLVSNKEYAEFVADGGYGCKEFWSELGWKWASDPTSWAVKTGYPLFWTPTRKLRTLAREVDMQDSWPVETNHYEAEAFCNWKSKKLGKTVRLITHPEWIFLRSRMKRDYNINFRWGSSCPVHAHGEPMGANGEDIFDIIGNVWQHSASPLTVLPNFTPHHLYDDFTMPTIDGEHYFILGGSWASAGNLARPESRYGFRNHFPQFAGIRYVCSRNEVEEPPVKVFTQMASLLSEHFLDCDNGLGLDVVPVANGPEFIGKAAAALVPDGGSVFVFQGGPGRATMEIAAHSQPASILHTDPTANVLEMLQTALKGTVRWERCLEGKITTVETFALPQHLQEVLKKVNVDVQQVNMFGGVMGAQITDGSEYDVVVADLTQLGRVHFQRRGEIPNELGKLVKIGGKILVVQPEDLTDFSALGMGFVEEGESIRFAHTARETRRTLRVAVSELSVWRKDSDVEYVTSSKRNARRNSACLDANSAQDISQAVRFPRRLSAPSIVLEQSAKLRVGEEFHFGVKKNCGIPNFPQKCAEICIKACRTFGVTMKQALDVGCGPGRCAIELADKFDHVVAVDGAQEFLNMLDARKPKNVQSFCGDVSKIDKLKGVSNEKFDLIITANLLDRLPQPVRWMERIKGLLAETGILVIFSPFAWAEEDTRVDEWLGGFRKDAEVCWSLHGVVKTAYPQLTLRQPPTHVPFMMRHEDGTNQLTNCQLLIFGKMGIETKDANEFLRPGHLSTNESTTFLLTEVQSFSDDLSM